MTEYDVKLFEKKFIDFMHIKGMPVYSFESKKVSLLRAENEGFDSIAQAFYKPDTQQHTLIVADNIPIEPYIMYHEFTHILDAEEYSKGDKTRYASSLGYTEYHASQVELLVMLDARTIQDQIEFSGNQIVTTVAGEKSVREYVDMKRSQAVDLFQREDFPQNIEQLKTAIGVLFNYWGLRSICYMYCKDFKEETDIRAFTKYISADVYNAMNTLMVGWLSDGLIDICCKGYCAMIEPLIKKYNLA